MKNKGITKNQKKVIIITICVILFLLCAVMIWLMFTGGFPTKTKDISKYGEFKNFKGYSDLLIFPDEDIESDVIKEYYYSIQDTIFDPTCQIYLECQYDETGYAAEKERLASLCVISDRNETQGVLEDKNSLGNTVYMASTGLESCYEYAVINDADLKIHYIFMQGILERKMVFDMDLLPISYDPNSPFGDNCYSIYAFKNENTNVYEWQRDRKFE